MLVGPSSWSLLPQSYRPSAMALPILPFFYFSELKQKQVRSLDVQEFHFLARLALQMTHPSIATRAACNNPSILLNFPVYCNVIPGECR